MYHMNTMKAELKGNELIIRLKVHDPSRSKTGKNMVIASSRGLCETSIKIAGKPVVISAAAFVEA